MKYIHRRLKGRLCNKHGEIAIYSCFFVVGTVVLIPSLLLYTSIRINCINVRNGARIELNNLGASICADTYRSQKETNFNEYLSILYSSSSYTGILEDTVREGLLTEVPLSTDDYKIKNITPDFHVTRDRVKHMFCCDAEFYVKMFGHSYPVITQEIELTEYHSTEF